jgi:purine catabolism regulator
MSLTLAALLHRADLGLQLRLGEPGREVTWVHVSDLADPSPYLEPGCMLLTTGLSFGDDAQHWSTYVVSLRAVGVPALGFGVGLRHKHVPQALLDAAAKHDLALIEVPERTRFSQVIQAVVDIGTREDRAHHALVLERHRELLKAASTPPAHRSLVARLQEQVGGWVLLLGRDRQVLAVAPDAARDHANRVRAEVQRTAAMTSARYEIGEYGVTTLPIGVDRFAGWLSVGRPAPLAAAERSVVDATVALLQLDIARAAELLDAERRERRAVLDLLLAGQQDVAVSVAEKLGVALPEGRIRLAILLPADQAGPDLLEALESDRSLQLGSSLITVDLDGSVVVIIPAGKGNLASLRRVLAANPGSRGVVGEPTELAEIGPGVSRLRTVLGEVRSAAGLVIAKDLAADGLIAQLDGEAGRAWSDLLLGPLTSPAAGRVDLLDTVRTYLGNNAGAEATANALGIHRRTLGYRLGKAEQLLDRSLSDPTVRAELWIALQLRGR